MSWIRIRPRKIAAVGAQGQAGVYTAVRAQQHEGMSDRVVRVDPAAPAADAIRQAAEVIRQGGLVAFPTETVYGLGANALDDAAVRRIFAAKGRPDWNPLIVHVPDADAVHQVAAAWPPLARQAAAAFWPGPLTLVVPRRPEVPDVVTAGLTTVGIRVPAHPVAHALLTAAGVPVAAPSANRFTRVSPTLAEHVIRGLGHRADLIVDGGATPYGIESTVLDVSGSRPRVLRYGAISVEELVAVLGPVDEATLAGSPTSDGVPHASPGMSERHYSPAARIVTVRDLAEAGRMVAETEQRGGRVGALVRGMAGVPAAQSLALPDDPRGFARLFYAALHTLDDAGCTIILVEQPPEGAAWAAIRDRIQRATR
jgi:L-threonylcarbamoyladenylate synthase